MTYRRAIEEAISIIVQAIYSCGAVEGAREALQAINDLRIEDAIDLLYYAADNAKMLGCLDWYLFVNAADILSRAL